MPCVISCIFTSLCQSITLASVLKERKTLEINVKKFVEMGEYLPYSVMMVIMKI